MLRTGEAWIERVWGCLKKAYQRTGNTPIVDGIVAILLITICAILSAKFGKHEPLSESALAGVLLCLIVCYVLLRCRVFPLRQPPSPRDIESQQEPQSSFRCLESRAELPAAAGLFEAANANAGPPPLGQHPPEPSRLRGKVVEFPRINPQLPTANNVRHARAPKTHRERDYAASAGVPRYSASFNNIATDGGYRSDTGWASQQARGLPGRSQRDRTAGFP
jgi:hypothetical protein